MGNVLKNPHIGMLFIDFAGQRRLRLQGTAAISADDALLATSPGAQFMVRVQVTEVYWNCPRYIHTYQRVERSPYVPRAGWASHRSLSHTIRTERLEPWYIHFSGLRRKRPGQRVV
jgi:hypothetical protein